MRFGRKVVEVSTFRRQAPAEEGDTLIRRDNTFGTPEEDAFRRDFTVNALFYDIATFSVIDYVGGLEDLRAARRSARSATRRCASARTRCACCARWRWPRGSGFTIDRDTLEAIRSLRGEIVKSSPARILEEIYKILRQGASRQTFEMLHDVGPARLPAARGGRGDRASSGERLLGSLAPARRLPQRRPGRARRADATRCSWARCSSRWACRCGARRGGAGAAARERPEASPRTRRAAIDVAAEMAALGDDDEDDGAPRRRPRRRSSCPSRAATSTACASSWPRRAGCARCTRSPRVKHLLAGRGYLEEALRWMEIHGGVQGQELAAHWRAPRSCEPAPDGAADEAAAARHGRATRRAERAAAPPPPAAAAAAGASPPSRRRSTVGLRRRMARLTDERGRARACRAARLGAATATPSASAYTFDDFTAAIAFVNRVAELAEAAGPPPGHPRRSTEGHADPHQPRRRRADRARLRAGARASTL